MRVLFAAIAVATARAEELPSEVEELRAAAVEAISPNSQSGSIDFLKLTNRLAELGDYDFLGLLLQKTISDVRPEYSEMIVARILDAPTGEEFTPDLAEALIDCIDFFLRQPRPRDEIATGWQIVGHRIAVVLEDGLGISSSEFDFRAPSVALKYIDEAKQAIARLRREGGVCRITEEVQGGKSHFRARELIIARDEARASGGQREEKREARARDRLPPVKESAEQAAEEDSAAGKNWGIGLGVAVLGAVAVFFVWRGRSFARS